MSKNANHNYRLLFHFSICEDPCKHRIRHKLIDIIAIVVLATLCGEEGWEDIHDWAIDRIDFLKEFLELTYAIPSPDTFRRVIERIKPEQFLEAFLSWTEELRERKPGQISIDGKTLRKARDARGSLHLVSAFAVENGLTIGCKDAGGKGKEIAAIKELLNDLNLKVNDVVTIDAIGCQKEIAFQIKNQKADYLIALKRNQGLLYDETENFFIQAFDAEEYAPVKTAIMIQNGHGRKDTQKIWVAQDVEWLDARHEWKGLRRLVCVQREWSTNGDRKTEKRFYISSADKTAEEFGFLIKRHWSIENEYHWHLDVNFKEDDSEIAARSNKILRLARTIALQLLKAEPTQGMSVARKKKRCQRSISFLKSVLHTAKF